MNGAQPPSEAEYAMWSASARACAHLLGRCRRGGLANQLVDRSHRRATLDSAVNDATLQR